MVDVRMDFDRLAAQTGRMAEVADGLDGRVASAVQAVEQLLGAGWSGASAVAFGDAFAQWDEAARDCVRALERIVAGVRGAVADFAAAEQAGENTAAGLGGAVPHLDLASIMGAR